MKCPHCEYEDGWSGVKCCVVKGEHGEFYFLEAHKMIREERYGDKERMCLKGCPKCNMLFMSEEGYS